MTLSELNILDRDAFTTALADIFEHSSWIPLATWRQRPFAEIEDLHAGLCATLDAAGDDQKLELIRAHPDLAGKLAVAGKLTAFSTNEQQSARLDQLSAEQFAHISDLNTRYREKFGFPFIICVKDHTQESIFANFQDRINHNPVEERTAALFQIKRIAWHRLSDLID